MLPILMITEHHRQQDPPQLPHSYIICRLSPRLGVSALPAPLEAADWERIAARASAYWKAHWAAEEDKLRSQNSGLAPLQLIEASRAPESSATTCNTAAAPQKAAATWKLVPSSQKSVPKEGTQRSSRQKS
ncbi:hypothetical protein PtB15_7B160 [Puccinia triticina]|nr:hypothetical protein PtB15_7B160 [Puccinia triticina]